MMIEGLTFCEALKKLADQHGIALPKQSLRKRRGNPAAGGAL